MKLKEIYEFLDKLSPFELQEKWDNSGLIVGSYNQEITQIVTALDLDEELIESSDDGVLFVVHHPLIFGGLDSLDFDKYPSNLIQKLISKNQALIATHTNFDKTHLNRFVFEEVLGFRVDKCEGFVCYTDIDWELERLLKRVKIRLDLPNLKLVSPKEHIGTIALTTGAGASLIDEVEADCLLTGDIKYHDAIKALNQNMMMIDIGHYESERFFAEVMGRELKILPILVIITNSKNPFVYKNI
jgi:dinuclear metal center YbgI/SA1388 family protein